VLGRAPIQFPQDNIRDANHLRSSLTLSCSLG
jgi:hypothetical protein